MICSDRGVVWMRLTRLNLFAMLFLLGGVFSASTAGVIRWASVPHESARLAAIALVPTADIMPAAIAFTPTPEFFPTEDTCHPHARTACRYSYPDARSSDRDGDAHTPNRHKGTRPHPDAPACCPLHSEAW